MIYSGWIACISFLVLFILLAGITFSYGEILEPLSEQFHDSLSLLGE